MDREDFVTRLNMLQPLSLGTFPTPLMPLPALSAKLGGPEIWVKRDDLTGLGMGGNKVRKLNFLMADALRQGADVVMTTGAQQSNHARQTAAAAAALGLPCVLVLGGEKPAGAPQGNYLLDCLLGAEVRWGGNRPLMAALEAEAETLRQQGHHPYVAPYGGSSAVGICGFAAALVELLEQAQALGLTFDAMAVASSSGGTQAGLMVASKALRDPTRIVGISIAERADPFRERMARLGSEAAALLKLDFELVPEDFTVADGYLGGGYGVVRELEREAISMAARFAGLLVDPVYTGRALGGLVDLIRRGTFTARDRVLFWHTGGAPALFAYAEELVP